MAGAAAALAMPARAGNEKLVWAGLLHLGGNMWDDYDADPDGWAKSYEESLERPNPKGPFGTVSRYCSYLRCDDAVWRRTTDAIIAMGDSQAESFAVNSGCLFSMYFTTEGQDAENSVCSADLSSSASSARDIALSAHSLTGSPSFISNSAL